MAWTWWRGQPKSLTDPLRFTAHHIKKAAVQNGPVARVPLAELQYAMQLAAIHVHEDELEPCQDPQYVMAPTILLKELSLVLRIIDLENSLYQHDSMNKTAPNVHKRQPAIFQRLKKLAPKGIGQLTTLQNSSGLITTTKEVEQEVRATRGFWTEPPPELAQNLQDLLKETPGPANPLT